MVLKRILMSNCNIGNIILLIIFFTKSNIEFESSWNRCIFTNINPETGVRNPNREPFETLVKNRTIIPDQTPVMGVQMGIRVTGTISIGDAVYINDESEA